jgi:copper oxidase (laccase) domain-containing protein
MIVNDQPTIFNNDVIVALSSIQDGNMSLKHDEAHDALENRKAFFKKIDININHATLLQISFDGVVDFARYTTLTDAQKTEGMLDRQSVTIADALVVTEPGHAIFLPVADCAPTVLYDATHHVLMVSHLGRQSVEIEGAKKSVEYLQREFNTNPQDIKVWVGPAVGKQSYKLYKLDNKGLHEVILQQLHAAGVLDSNVEVSSIDTAQNENYFSHSKHLKSGSINDGRFAVVAAMRVQGEPAS